MNKRVGRPSTYTKKKGNAVCEKMAEGLSLNQIAEIEGMPGPSAVRAWRNRYPEFADQYARAVLDRLEFLADQMNEIADDGRNDYMDRLNAKGEVVGQMVNQEVVQRSRLRIDTIKWQLSKLIPKKYGDKLDLNVGGQKDAPPLQSIVTVTTDPVQAAKLYQEAMRGITHSNADQKSLPSPDADLPHEHDAESYQVCGICNVSFCEQCACKCAERNSR
jgi:terminase small subunit-like protein